MTSDQTIPRPKMPLIRPSSKDFLTTSRPLSRRLCNHGPDDCARQMTSDQTIPRPKMPLIRPSSKDFLSTSGPLSRRLCNHGPTKTRPFSQQLFKSDDLQSDYPKAKMPLFRPVSRRNLIGLRGKFKVNQIVNPDLQ